MKKDCLWYRQPGEKFTDALPLGNGRLGAMVHGGMEEDRIQIDENTYWSGKSAQDNDKEDTYGLMWEIRKALLKGDYEEADRLGQAFVGRKNQYGTNMPTGILTVRLCDAEESEEHDYYRELDLSCSIAAEQFNWKGGRVKRETFVSDPAQVFVFRMQSEKPLSLELGYEGICSQVGITGLSLSAVRQAMVYLSGDARETLHSDGTCGVHLEGCFLVETDGEIAGKLTAKGRVQVKDARILTLYLDMRTTMFDAHPLETAENKVMQAARKGFAELRREHVADTESLYGRMFLSLGDEERRELPTDVRVREAMEGKEDRDLYALMFQFGRYVMFASSREDSLLATHMGGIWNDDIYNHEDCTQDMHIDMNLQMQYWGMAQCSLPECYAPYFKYVEEILMPNGERSARTAYHAEGWAAHVVSNPWGFTALGWSYNWGVFSLGGAWCALLAWDYYTYTRDLEWLKGHGLPILKGAAQFAADYVFYDEKSGYYMAGPSYSPENMFRYEGKAYFLSLSTTCDILLVREVLTDCLKAMAAAGEEDQAFRERAQEILSKLPPYRVGREGRLQEWYEDFEDAIPNHRHTSHLLGLYPYRQILPEEQPQLAAAAQKSMERRLEDFELTSWGMNMMMGYYARMFQGDKALEMLKIIFQRIVRNNMVSVMSSLDTMWHGTWELDGNTGLTSAMAEMLVQSFEEETILLPALPESWKDGEIRGIALRGGHHLDLVWRNGEPTEIRLLPGCEDEVKLRWKKREWRIACRPGEVWTHTS